MTNPAPAVRKGRRTRRKRKLKFLGKEGGAEALWTREMGLMDKGGIIEFVEGQDGDHGIELNERGGASFSSSMSPRSV